jgi:long-chain-alcohol oxidase
VTLSARNLDTFDVVVDTVLPGIHGDSPNWTTPGAALRLSDGLPRVYDLLPHDSDRQQLRLLLGLLNTRLGGLALYGRPAAFTSMPPEGRSEALRRMARSRMETTRRGVRTLTTLVGLLWVSGEDPDSPPQTWSEIGYPGPSGPPPRLSSPIPVESITSDTVMEADVVIVGSGAGGGVAAGVLSDAGLRVVVLEKGGARSVSDFSHLEAEAYRMMYRDAGLATTGDGGTILLAGSTLGGGTVINYTTAFRTPDRVRQQWDQVAGFDGVFTGPDFDGSLDAVSTRLGVNSETGTPSKRDSLMEEGLRSLGWHVAEMPRNATGCTQAECGYCSMGCRIGAKQSTLATYLTDAAASGARIVAGADVMVVESDRGRAAGAVARVGYNTLRVKAPTVVLAAGALDTPAILLRSRLGGPAVGRHLRLHPVTALWGRFREPVEPWTGTPQARYSDQFADLDGEGYGFRFETAPLHPLFPSVFNGWEDGASFKRDVLGLGNTNVVGILLRDRGSGRVTVRKDGSSIVRYRISQYDRAHIRVGVNRAAELLAAEGAIEVRGSTVIPNRWTPSEGDLEGFMGRADRVGYGPNSTSYFSFHQMGSGRMGSDPATSVVDALNQVHDLKGLYVMDASCFPNASGVNPMLTIAAIAHRGSTALADRLA